MRLNFDFRAHHSRNRHILKADEKVKERGKCTSPRAKSQEPRAILI